MASPLTDTSNKSVFTQISFYSIIHTSLDTSADVAFFLPSPISFADVRKRQEVAMGRCQVVSRQISLVIARTGVR